MYIAPIYLFTHVQSYEKLAFRLHNKRTFIHVYIMLREQDMFVYIYAHLHAHSHIFLYTCIYTHICQPSTTLSLNAINDDRQRSYMHIIQSIYNFNIYTYIYYSDTLKCNIGNSSIDVS